MNPKTVRKAGRGGIILRCIDRTYDFPSQPIPPLARFVHGFHGRCSPRKPGDFLWGCDSVKLPAFQFYPADWLKDPALRACSLEARGLWMDMLCLMHESPRRGYLQHVNGGPVSPEQLGRMTGCQPDRVAVLLSELESVGVFSRAERDVIFNRRMARDENKRALCQEAGKLGGNPALTLNRGVKGGSKGPPNPPPTPSSSSSSSSSSSDKSKSVCVTREPARISPEPPKLPPIPSAMAWSEAREKIMAAFPPSESPASPKAVAMAVDRLTMYGDSAIFPDNRPAAIDYLLVRVRAWANSPKCKSMEARYRPGMAKWFGEEMYLAPDSDWAVAAIQRPANGKPAEDDPAADLARIHAAIDKDRADRAARKA